jgi:hypothetical protein
MSVQVKNGTPLHGPSLCETCSHGLILKGYRLSEELAMCRAIEPVLPLPFPVRECTNYLDKTRENLYDMRQAAWTISPERGKKTAGFMRAGSTDAGEDIQLVLDEEE